MADYITTWSGIHFTPLEPKKEEIRAEDIAHALSLMTRANGHFPEFYSVAQHCIHCCEEAGARSYSARVQAACLLHDGSEAYLADITRPVKKHLPGYLSIEEVLQSAKYVEFLEVLFGPGYDVIPALVLTRAADLYTHTPIGNTDAVLPVCSGDMLFNLFDEYIGFLRK